jgi:hypothetical protein
MPKPPKYQAAWAKYAGSLKGVNENRGRRSEHHTPARSGLCGGPLSGAIGTELKITEALPRHALQHRNGHHRPSPSRIRRTERRPIAALQLRIVASRMRWRRAPMLPMCQQTSHKFTDAFSEPIAEEPIAFEEAIKGMWYLLIVMASTTWPLSKCATPVASRVFVWTTP